MKPVLQPNDPVVVAYLATLERLDKEGWDRLIRLGRAMSKEARGRPRTDAVRALTTFPEEWAKGVAGVSARPFEGTLVPAEQAATLASVYEATKEIAFLAYGAVHPVFSTPDEAHVSDAQEAAQADRWAEQMDKATRIAAIGAVLLSMKGCRAEWASAWTPWQEMLDSISPPDLITGDWNLVIKLRALPVSDPTPRSGLGRLLSAKEPRFGAATREVEELLRTFERLDGDAWEHLENLYYGFRLRMSLSEPSAVVALEPVVELGWLRQNAARFAYAAEESDSKLDRALANADLAGEKRSLLRAYAAAALVAASQDPSEESEQRKNAAGLAACLLVIRRHLAPDVWKRIWGGPLE